MDVSESSTSESVNPVPSSKVKAPSYEERYSREDKKQKDRKKEVSAKPPASSTSKVKESVVQQMTTPSSHLWWYQGYPTPLTWGAA